MSGAPRKHIVYTRTSAALHAMPAYGLKGFDTIELQRDRDVLKTLVCAEPFTLESGETVCLENLSICPLSQITTQDALADALGSFCEDPSKLLFVTVINMEDAPSSR